MKNIKVKINDVIVETNFFDSFNWFNFEYGDKVYLDDCYETDFMVAEFCYAENNKSGRVVSLSAQDTIENSKGGKINHIRERIQNKGMLAASKHLVDAILARPDKRIDSIKLLREMLMLAHQTGFDDKFGW